MTLRERVRRARVYWRSRALFQESLVEGLAYTLQHLPQSVELLKLDCEGAEYHLLGDDRFLAHLAPREICMDYHRGPEALPAQPEYAPQRDEDEAQHQQLQHEIVQAVTDLRGASLHQIDEAHREGDAAG